MKGKKYIVLTILLALVLSLILPSCSEPTAEPTTAEPTTAPEQTTAPTQESTPKYGGIFKLGASSDITATPGYTPKFKGTRVSVQAIFEVMLKTDKEGNPLPWLLTEWELDPDGKYIDFHCREGVKFHDGTDFNAEAVKYNLEKIKEYSSGAYPGVTSIEVIDEYIVRLNLDYFTPTLFYSFTVSSTGIAASPTQLAKGEDEANANPVGTGPFKLYDLKRGSYVKAKRFDDYWDEGKPYLDEVWFVQIPDKATLSAAFMAGEVHALQPFTKEARELIDAGYPSVTMMGNYFGLTTDSANPDSPFADVRVRQAVECAINKEAITKAVGYGFLEPLNQYASKTYDVYNSETGRFYDLDKARQLLEGTGLEDGFEFDLSYYAVYSDADVLVAVQQQLSELGITVNLKPSEVGTIGEYRARGWNGMLLLVQGGVNDEFIAYHLNRVYGEGITDWVSTKRPDGFYDLLEQAVSTLDLAERKALTQDILKLMVDEAFVIPLYVAPAIVVYQPGLMGHDFNVWHSDDYTPGNMWWDK